MATKVIDVSRYQGVIDWDKVKADGVQAAMLKTVSTNKSFGGIYIDPQFERNYAECKRLGIPVGVYYYTYAQTLETAKAELAKLQQALAGKTFEMPIVCDVEENKLKPLSKAALTDLVEFALRTIQSWGCYAMVYTYTYYQQTELDMDRLSVYDLWIADYRGQRPSIPHGMWQYSSSGTVAGIAGRCDMNHCYKDYPAIIKKAGLNGLSDAAAAPETTAPAADPTGDFIRAVQAAIGVEVDGIVGPKTRAALPTISALRNRKHKAVKPLQARLIALGYSCGKKGADGIVGWHTVSAVRAYQKANGLTADGVVGQKTWARLLGI